MVGQFSRENEKNPGFFFIFFHFGFRSGFHCFFIFQFEFAWDFHFFCIWVFIFFHFILRAKDSFHLNLHFSHCYPIEIKAAWLL